MNRYARAYQDRIKKQRETWAKNRIHRLWNKRTKNLYIFCLCVIVFLSVLAKATGYLTVITKPFL